MEKEQFTRLRQGASAWQARLVHAGRTALDVLLPPLCLACDAPVASAGAICPACWGKLDLIAAPCCPLCGMGHELGGAEMICAACLTRPPRWQAARAAVTYDEHSRGIVLGFKHADQTHAAPAMARMMAQAGADILAGCDILAPVPLHRWRLFLRKYNQAALLAQAIGTHANLTAIPDLLLRSRATKPQGKMNRAKRARNVRGAFALAPRYQAMIADKTVCLIDDVLTTGATAGECTRVLQAAGAKAVKVLTFARVKHAESS